MRKPRLVGKFTMRPKHVLLEFGACVGFSYTEGPGPKPLFCCGKCRKGTSNVGIFSDRRQAYIYITCRAYIYRIMGKAREAHEPPT